MQECQSPTAPRTQAVALSRARKPRPGSLKEHRVDPAPGKTWSQLAGNVTDPFTLKLLHELDSGQIEAWEDDHGVLRFYASTSPRANGRGPSAETNAPGQRSGRATPARDPW